MKQDRLGLTVLGAIHLAVLSQCGPLAAAEELRIDVDAGSVAHTMRGGWGASWHAIERPIPYGKGFTHGGSAWGGNPPAENETAWQQLYRYADWLGMDWCRVEIEQRMYEPHRGQFDWDNPEMRILYRILDWCQKRHVDVFFQQMWGNVDWNTFPEWRGDPVRRVHSGPASVEDFAEGLATLVEYLLKQKRYTCVKWLCINNEPGYKWSWWQQPPADPMPITPGLKAVRRALNRHGLSVPLSGPDWTNLPPLDPSKIDFDHLIGAYDVHSYWANFDWRQGGYSLSEAERRLADWAKWAHRRGKPLFLSELGTMAFGWRDSDPNPSSYPAILKDAELVVRGLAVGVDGFNRWSFINRGDLDGQWQMVDTWDRQKKKLLERFTPHPNSYCLYGLITRFTAKRSSVLKTKVDGGHIDSRQRVFAAALRSPRGSLTILVVNDAESPWDAALTIRPLQQPRQLYRYRVTRANQDCTDVVVRPSDPFPVSPSSPALSDRIPPFSLTIYSTYQLDHDARGVIAD